MLLNSYSLEVYKKNGKPLFVVGITHIMLAGVYFFNTLAEAKKFIEEKKISLEKYAKLAYNEHPETYYRYVGLVDEVINDENIKIGKNGNTYI